MVCRSFDVFHSQLPPMRKLTFAKRSRSCSSRRDPSFPRGSRCNTEMCTRCSLLLGGMVHVTIVSLDRRTLCSSAVSTCPSPVLSRLTIGHGSHTSTEMKYFAKSRMVMKKEPSSESCSPFGRGVAARSSGVHRGSVSHQLPFQSYLPHGFRSHINLSPFGSAAVPRTVYAWCGIKRMEPCVRANPIFADPPDCFCNAT